MGHDKYDHFWKLVFFTLSQQSRFRKYFQFVRYVNPTSVEVNNWNLSGTPGIVSILEMNDFKNTFRRAPYEYPDLDYKSIVDYLN